MENTINASFTPLQVILALAFQMWIIVFPILIIRKLNYLTALLESKKSDDEQSEENEGSS